MDKIYDLGDFFSGKYGNTNPLVLILIVLIVVVGAVAVFIFGFKEAEPPKIRRRSSDTSSKNKKQRKVKRGKEESDAPQKDTPKPPQKSTAKPPAQKKPTKADATVTTTTSKVEASKPATTTTAVAASKKSDTAIAVSTAKAGNNTGKKVRGAAGVAAKKVSNGKEVLPAKSGDKISDNIAADGGDWQTVATKKQKKISESLLAQVTVAAVDAAAKVINSKENVKSSKNKKAKDKANKTKKDTSSEQLKQQEPAVETPAEKDSVETKVAVALVDFEVDVPAASLDLPKNIENAERERKQTTVDVAKETVEYVHAASGTETNRAGNELEDSGWQEAVTPKKTKRRALRE